MAEITQKECTARHFMLIQLVPISGGKIFVRLTIVSIFTTSTIPELLINTNEIAEPDSIFSSQ